MWPSALLHQGVTDLVTASFVLSDAQPVLKVRAERATDQAQAVKKGF